ncbi:Protein kinase-like superfamily protein [Klebsormidium nitens]|uniref:Protein kinase-like superfamily protein n=1 Tax=Klebsormidium nitens TaxID=105231 RepID=A0A1Y1IEV8_KLENI|nr:Protein kinase-like superfamily protein [Klebsormidium nitens]|eukprot:GAQ87247.1 Protein kinase-like superfamily protein [Klebsormidium nitens]
MTGKRLRLSQRTPKTAADPEVLQVVEKFVEKSGSQLANGWKLGKQLGRGNQGAVYLLEDEDGNGAGRVLKLVWNKTKAAIVGGFVLMEREWAIGRRLNLLNEEDGFLEGFTQTGSKILDKDGSFLGTVLEKLNGKGAKNRLEDPKFNDIDYILEMMTEVLRALDRARSTIGFRHGDMHIRNVMEHRVEEESGGPELETDKVSFRVRVNLRGLHFKIIDLGHAEIIEDQADDYEKIVKKMEADPPELPKLSPEKVYRAAFVNRDDVWRFVRSVSQYLGVRVWHEEDKLKVQLLLSIIKEITGNIHRAHFAMSNKAGEAKRTSCEKAMSVGGTCFTFKWFNVNIHAYFFPGRPTITPREALDFIEKRKKELGLTDRELHVSKQV